jgi:hypothetical protein
MEIETNQVLDFPEIPQNGPYNLTSFKGSIHQNGETEWLIALLANKAVELQTWDFVLLKEEISAQPEFFLLSAELFDTIPLLAKKGMVTIVQEGIKPSPSLFEGIDF